MILHIACLIYALILIVGANHELRSKDARPLSALLSLGITQIGLLWQTVEKLIARLNPFDQPCFDKLNPVHRAAGLLVVAHLMWNIWLLLSVQGGADWKFFAPDLRGILLNLAAAAALYLLLSALGVGWILRRDLQQTLRRLGLRRPTMGDCLAGLVIGILLSIGATLAASVFAPDLNASESGAPALFDILQGSLPASFAIALMSGAGEEILFRGALQPVFGLFLTSAMFTLAHAHLGLSPALLILFAVSIGFGLVRRRFSSSSAIICHATYNFTPFLLFRLLLV